MEDWHDDADARDQLAHAIRKLKHHSRLTERPTRGQIEEARLSGILWVRCLQTDGLPEALQLVASLADNHDTELLWHRAVQLAWPDASPLWLKNLRGHRFRLGVEIPVHIWGSWFSWCKKLVMEDENEMEDDEEEANPRPGIAVTTAIPVRLVVDDAAHNNPLALWRQLRKLVSIQVARETPSAFQITEIVVKDITEKWSPTSMKIAQMIAQDGVLVQPMNMQAPPLSLDDAAHYIPSVHRCFVGEDDDDNVPREHHERVAKAATVAVCIDSDKQTLDSIFSAVVASSTVRKIIVEQDKHTPGNRERLWQWLAVAFFTDLLANGIHELQLKSCSIRMSEVVELERMMSESNPFATLFPPRQHTSKRWFDAHLASASEFRLVEPCTGESYKMRAISSISFDTPVQNMVILDSSDEWIRVLLPGWGQAWVARGDAALSAKTNTPTASHHPTVLWHRLTLSEMDDEDGPVLRALFHVIGRSLQALTLDYCRFSDHTLKVILRECPNIEQLEILYVDDSTLRIITECYDSGHLRAEQIGIFLRAFEAETHVSSFFKCLANNSHALSQSVSVLHFTYEPSTWVASLHEPTLEMLVRNRTMREVYIMPCGSWNEHRRRDHLQDLPAEEAQDASEQIPPDTAEMADEAVYPDDGLQPYHLEGSPAAELNATDGLAVLDCRGLAMRIAFLSLACSDQFHADQLRAISRLDSNSLSMIFSFFAELRTRCVHVQLQNT